MRKTLRSSSFECALLNLGGTIGELYDRSGGLTRLSAREILHSAALPASWPGYDVAPVDSTEMDFAALFAASEVIAADVSSAAFILVCGTDMLEEIAFAASLLLPLDRPVVVTAAAIPYSALGTDGPGNLIRAATFIASDPSPNLYIVIGDMIFGASGLVKIEPQAIQPFAAINGPIGRFRGDAAGLFAPGSINSIFRDLSLQDCSANVAILTEVMGGWASFIDPTGLDGLVVAGAGGGGLSPRTHAMLKAQYLPNMPVVLSTRCPFGYSLNPASAKYAGRTALDDGFIVDDYSHLNALQARVRLVLEIGRNKRGAAQ